MAVESSRIRLETIDDYLESSYKRKREEESRAEDKKIKKYHDEREGKRSPFEREKKKKSKKSKEDKDRKRSKKEPKKEFTELDYEEVGNEIQLQSLKVSQWSSRFRSVKGSLYSYQGEIIL